MLKLSPEITSVLQELGYRTLTPIQSQSIPILLSGQDLIGQSKTGSGKTAAFVIPALEKTELSLRAPQSLILCPTRELCTQVAREMRRLARKHSGFQALVVCGGQPVFPQVAALKKGVHSVVGTPGRVMDLLRRGTLKLDRCHFYVLDEADRMLDMGFQEDMETILSHAPSSGRQTVFFSATFPRSIETLSRKYQKTPARVAITEESATPREIHQVFYSVDQDRKPEALLKLVTEAKPESAIIFCNQKQSVRDVTDWLKRFGLSIDCLHGDLEQGQRDRVMAKFRNQSTRILVATDVAARGIDVDQLTHVFNYDLPSDPEVYVHRIGRSGRAGRAGQAISLVSEREQRKLEQIAGFSHQDPKLKQLQLPSQGPATPARNDARLAPTMVTLSISGGRKDKVRPGDILGALTGEAAGLSADQVGKIEIHDRFSYVAIDREIATEAFERLRQGSIKGRKFRINWVR